MQREAEGTRKGKGQKNDAKGSISEEPPDVGSGQWQRRQVGCQQEQSSCRAVTMVKAVAEGEKQCRRRYG